MTNIDWSDVEFLLKKSYIQSRAYSSPLINRDNALNFSYKGSLSRTSNEALNCQRKIFQMAHDIYNTTDEENEKIILADLIDHYGEEFVLKLAKNMNLPAVAGCKIEPKSTNPQLLDSFMRNLTDNFVNEMHKISLVCLFSTFLE